MISTITIKRHEIYASGTSCALCGCTSFHVGRVTADCANCEMPIPLKTEKPGFPVITRQERGSRQLKLGEYA